MESKKSSRMQHVPRWSRRRSVARNATFYKLPSHEQTFVVSGKGRTGTSRSEARPNMPRSLRITYVVEGSKYPFTIVQLNILSSIPQFHPFYFLVRLPSIRFLYDTTTLRQLLAHILSGLYQTASPSLEIPQHDCA